MLIARQPHIDMLAGVPLPELQRDLSAVVRRICPASLRNDAEDVVQESLVKLMRLQDQEGRTFTKAYLKQVVHSVIIDELRKRARRPVMESDVGGEADAVVDRPQGDPLDDTRHHIEACLSLQLDGRRRAVTLHLLGHSVPEVAKKLGCKAKRAENWVYRGLQQLRECLASRGVQV